MANMYTLGKKNDRGIRVLNHRQVLSMCDLDVDQKAISAI